MGKDDYDATKGIGDQMRIAKEAQAQMGKPLLDSSADVRALVDAANQMKPMGDLFRPARDVLGLRPLSDYVGTFRVSPIRHHVHGGERKPPAYRSMAEAAAAQQKIAETELESAQRELRAKEEELEKAHAELAKLTEQRRQEQDGEKAKLVDEALLQKTAEQTGKVVDVANAQADTVAKQAAAEKSLAARARGGTRTAENETRQRPRRPQELARAHGAGVFGQRASRARDDARGLSEVDDDHRRVHRADWPRRRWLRRVLHRHPHGRRDA